MPQIDKVLIANRGEVALRIIRAVKELGLRTVAVHSEVDAEALHVRFADESVCIGPGSSSESYLSIPALISAAEITGADALHPGYGFLSESSELAELCEQCGLTFIGPSPKIMRTMGDKVRARETVASAGINHLPGSPVISTAESLETQAAKIGFPLIIKASAGGGGRGMKIVTEKKNLLGAWTIARREAEAGFGNPDVYLERYLVHPRHIEVQIMADHHGNILSIGDRECSIQRRHQKLVEEAPSPGLQAEHRDKLHHLCVGACRALGYTSLGTMEFLMDAAGECYFMEMNTRLQVEHTVTEETSGIDLVQMQLRIAADQRLSLSQKDVHVSGHAIECRINAEDARTFAPSPGTISALHLPGGFGVRIDTALYAGYTVPPHYDSLIAKVIVRGGTRDQAVARLGRVLDEIIIEGISTNIELFQRIVASERFRRGETTTGFLETEGLLAQPKS